MARTVAIGVQNFEKMITNHCFYVDKTHFINELALTNREVPFMFSSMIRGWFKGRIRREYNGFVLGLMVELAGRYRVTSNRESGYAGMM